MTNRTGKTSRLRIMPVKLCTKLIIKFIVCDISNRVLFVFAWPQGASSLLISQWYTNKFYMLHLKIETEEP